MLVRVAGTCVFCKSIGSAILAPSEFERACSGDVRSIRSVRDREFLISGICHKCQVPVFEQDHGTDEPPADKIPVTKAYVTNASARSVAFYAMAYLNNQGYDKNKIAALRRDMSLENMATGRFTIEELLESFERQSAFFLNLYRQLSEGEFLRFAEQLMSDQCFFRVFKRYDNVYDLMQHFNRTIFHTSLECDWMRHDYEEETFHPNTGVFHEKVARKAHAYYVINVDYLQELKMRPCKMCPQQ